MSKTKEHFRQNAANVPKSSEAVTYTHHVEKPYVGVRLKQVFFFHSVFIILVLLWSGRHDVSASAGERASRRGHGTGVLMNNWRGRRKMEAPVDF